MKWRCRWMMVCLWLVRRLLVVVLDLGRILNKHGALQKAGLQIRALPGLSRGISPSQLRRSYCIPLLSSSSLAVYLFSKVLLTSAISHGKKSVSISGNHDHKYDKRLNTHLCLHAQSIMLIYYVSHIILQIVWNGVQWCPHLSERRKLRLSGRRCWRATQQRKADLSPRGHRSNRGFSVRWRLPGGGRPSTAGCTPGQQSSQQSLFLSSTPPSALQFYAPDVRRNVC